MIHIETCCVSLAVATLALSKCGQSYDNNINDYHIEFNFAARFSYPVYNTFMFGRRTAGKMAKNT